MMTLQERLETLQEELNRQMKYREKVQKVGSTIDYSAEDFERESMLQRKIRETKDWINGKH
jgi:hypothetical protein